MMFAGVLGRWFRVGTVMALITATLLPAVADDGALVMINDRPLSRKKVVDLLMETHGLRIMQQLIILDLAKQETRRRGLDVTEADVQAQLRRALDEIAPARDAAGVTLSDAEKRKALEKVLGDRCLTLPEFIVAMERNAHLRKVVEGSFRVDEATLREEFARTYGEKVQVRHVAVRANDTRGLHEVIDRLARGEDLAEVAREISANRETGGRGGMMAPFTFTDDRIPATMREVAFSLSPGEVSSPTLVGEMIHVLKLERRIPPEDASFEDVRDEVEARLRERTLRRDMTELITKLFKRAKIRVLDRRLKQEYEELLKEHAAGPAFMP